MSGIRYLQGDATSPQSKGRKIVAHVCNDRGGWGKGFVLAVSRRWPEPEIAYRAWHRNRAHNTFELGALQIIQVDPQVWVANMIGQHGTRTGSKKPPVRYDAIRTALTTLREHARELDASIHMPRIGCGLAGGHWEHIETAITTELTDHDIDVTIYDHTDRQY